MNTAKLIAAVEALPTTRGTGCGGSMIYSVPLADVLNLIREHDPTAAIVAWLEQRAAKAFRRAEPHGRWSNEYRTAVVIGRECEAIIRDLKSGKVGL